MKKNEKEIVINILIIVLVFVGIFFLAKNTKNTERIINTNSSKNNTEIITINQNDHIWGNPNAKVILIEYSDTECPFCKMFHETMKRVISTKGNEIAWVYRHYPVKSLSFKESLATECAYEQGGNNGFWQYINTLYMITPSNDGLNPQELYNIANQMNFDINQFTSCVNNETYASKIYEDLESAEKLGVNGTPNSFIIKDGKIVDTILGAQDYETIIRKIEAQLK